MTIAENSSTASNPNHSSRLLNVSLCIFAIFVLATGIAVHNSGPPRLHEGEVVSGLGEYSSPNDEVRLRVSKTHDDNIKLVVRRPVRWFYIFRTFQDHRVMHYEHERGWFLCFDASDELWLFYGHWKREWGRPRTLPSGDTRPSAATVFRFSRTRGSCLSPRFNWDGVPADFLKKIPAADESVWGPNHKFLPEAKRHPPAE